MEQTVLAPSCLFTYPRKSALFLSFICCCKPARHNPSTVQAWPWSSSHRSPGSTSYNPEALWLEACRHRNTLPRQNPAPSHLRWKQSSATDKRKESSWRRALLLQSKAGSLQRTETQGDCSAPCPAAHQPSPFTRDMNDEREKKCILLFMPQPSVLGYSLYFPVLCPTVTEEFQMFVHPQKVQGSNVPLYMTYPSWSSPEPTIPHACYLFLTRI